MKVLDKVRPGLQKEAWGLRLGSRLVNQKKDELAFRFANAMKAELLREDVLRTVAARSARLKDPGVLWPLASSDALKTPTERVATFLGLIEGLAAAKRHP